MILEKGDIMVFYTKRFFISKAIAFFTTEWWLGEDHTVVSHAEMVYAPTGDGTSINFDEEPPRYGLKNRDLENKKVFRLKNKPDGFDSAFDLYYQQNKGNIYNYFIFPVLIFWWASLKNKWIGRLISKVFKRFKTNTCSSGVAKFYEQMGIPCSTIAWPATAPDDIYDYCNAHPEIFMVVSDLRS
jgi:hypothetical protein